jgi:hypothetical protein
MRVIVCGSRTFTDHETLFGTLTGLFVCHYSWGPDPCDDELAFIVGGARGADAFALEWARTWGVGHEVFDADWTRYNAAAGPIRNKAMLDSGVDEVVAFIDKPLYESAGTKNMVLQARKAGVKTIVIEVTPSVPSGTSPQQSSPQLFSE